MRLLILGGTVFVGRALTDAALARGHALTHLNRGKSSPDDPRVTTVHADRADDAQLRQALGDGRWDAVIDTSGYMPQVVRLSADALRERVARYLFVSTISVHAQFDAAGFDETAPVSPPPDPLPAALDMALYGPLKAACETVVRDTIGARATLVRPGLIVGPHDPTDRFTYWPVRVARGGEVLAPGRPAQPVQVIDVRDLALWMVDLLERDVGGTFTATGPPSPLTMSGFLEACLAVTGGDARFTWASDDALLAAGAGPWKEVPLWIPDSDATLAGLRKASITRALAEGLAFRPLAATIRDTLDWALSRPTDHAWKAGMTAQRERELLDAVAAYAPSAI